MDVVRSGVDVHGELTGELCLGVEGEFHFNLRGHGVAVEHGFDNRLVVVEVGCRHLGAAESFGHFGKAVGIGVVAVFDDGGLVDVRSELVEFFHHIAECTAVMAAVREEHPVVVAVFLDDIHRLLDRLKEVGAAHRLQILVDSLVEVGEFGRVVAVNLFLQDEAVVRTSKRDDGDCVLFVDDVDETVLELLAHKREFIPHTARNVAAEDVVDGHLDLLGFDGLDDFIFVNEQAVTDLERLHRDIHRRIILG